MIVLGLDTSTSAGSVGLVEDDRIIGEYTLDIRATHSERFMPALVRLLNDAGVELKDVDGIAVALGPGSYTGLRIGVVAAKMLAYACGKPLAGVSSLEVLAEGIWSPGRLICPMIDAKRSQVYAALFRRAESGALERLKEDELYELSDLLGELELLGEEIVFTGDGMAKNMKMIGERLGQRAVQAPRGQRITRGSSVAFLGLDHIKSGAVLDPFEIVPKYLRRSEAEIRWEEKRKSCGVGECSDNGR